MSVTGSVSSPLTAPTKLRVVMAQQDFLVGDIPGNTELVIASVHKALEEHQADIVVFPDLDIRISEALERLLAEKLPCAVVVGAPIREAGLLYNAAVVIDHGKLVGRYFKRFPPNYQVFDEKRYFAEGSGVLTLDIRGVPVGISVCEDLWKEGPVEDAAAAGARLILNLNASPYHVDKQSQRKALLERKSRDNGVSIVYVNLVGGQDELVFDGGSMVYDGDRCPGLCEQKRLQVSGAWSVRGY